MQELILACYHLQMTYYFHAVIDTLKGYLEDGVQKVKMAAIMRM